MNAHRAPFVLACFAAAAVACTGTEDGTVPGDSDSGAPQDSIVGGDGAPPGEGGVPDAKTDAATDGGDTRAGGDVAPGTDPLDPAAAPPIDTDPTHYPGNVWITSALAKVQPGDSPPAGAVKWALMSAAANEFESVQVHVRAGGSALAGLTVTVSDLVDAADPSAKIGADTIVVSRVAYLDVSMPSDANGLTGKVPDGLIPAVDPMLHEKRNAFPYDVAAGTTQSVWLDVQVPKGAKSGWYTGTIDVSAASGSLAKLPVRLKVWSFALPSTATLRGAFGMGWNSACVQAYGDYSACGKAVASGSADEGVEYFHQMYAAYFLDHRVTLGDVVYYGPTTGDWTHFDATYGPLLDGTASTRLPGAKLTGIRYSGKNDPTLLKSWADHFKAKGWYDRLYFYHCDEPPNGCSFVDAKAEEDAVHAAVSDFKTLLTTDYAAISKNGMLDSVDVATPVVDYLWPRGGTNQRPTYDDWLKKPNKELFWYQSCDEHESCSNGTAGGATSTWPSYMADASPVRNRVFQWMAHLFDVRGELYYASDLCFTDGAACGGTDPWKSVYAFGGHGDGTLVYPGNPAVIGGTHHVPCASMRLEHIRDGMEDFEYLKLLDAAGEATFAKDHSAFIKSTYEFDGDPAKLLGEREAIGDALHAKSLGK